MKKPSIKLVSESSISSVDNAKNLVKEADLLFQNHCYARAYFLSQIAIEELGKTSMLIASVQYPNELKEFWKLFWKKFRDHDYKIGKAEISRQNHRLNLQITGDNDEIFIQAGRENMEKMKSLYVDILDDKVIDPQEQISPKDTLSKMSEAKEKLEIFLERNNAGFYNTETLKEIEDFYSDSVIRESQAKLLITQEISFETYLRVIIERSKSIKDNQLAKQFVELASLIPVS